MDEHLTSSEVARLLGVAPSSVKRWTDSGLLRCVVTPGRHRRFTRRDVTEFARSHRAQLAAQPPLEFVDTLLSEQPLAAIQSEILAVRARERTWYETVEALAPALAEIGARWARGEITILAEHRASERFARALSACAETIVVANDPPLALLATVEGDDHTLGLNLAELCVREAGWKALWGGRRMPGAELVRRLEQGGIGLVALSASESSSDAYALAQQVELLAPVCQRTGAQLVLGGSGAWPADATRHDGVHRIERFAQLHELLVAGMD
ncbi:MAG: helix-turn-helix domain-containing protein [Planctomycetota bacterium]